MTVDKIKKQGCLSTHKVLDTVQNLITTKNSEPIHEMVQMKSPNKNYSKVIDHYTKYYST